jgi:hypothetical protein
MGHLLRRNNRNLYRLARKGMNPNQTFLSLGGHGVLNTDYSIGMLNEAGLSKLLIPLDEASLKNIGSRDVVSEFKTLTQVTNTEQHSKSLFVNEQTKSHNRYSDILPCKFIITSRCSHNGETSHHLEKSFGLIHQC